MKALGTKQILDKALELETGSELSFTFEDSRERERLYSDLLRRKLWLIRDEKLAEYEQVVIEKQANLSLNSVVLRKRSLPSGYIKKRGGTPEEVTF